jgi:hypothetical protein
MPPLMIEPIDFVSLYQAKMAQAAQQAAQGGQPANGSLDLETSFSAGVGPDIN